MLKILPKAFGIIISFILLFTYVFADEIDLNFATATVPSLGNYHIQYLHTGINKDKLLTEGFNQLADLNFKEAINKLNKCIEQRGPAFIANNPNKVNPYLSQEDKLIISEAYTLIGYCQMNLAERDKAINSCKRALILNPKNEYAYFYIGNVYLQAGDTIKMQEYLTKSLQLNPKFTTAMRIMAESFRDQGDHTNANKYYKTIVDYLPESGYYRFQYYRSLLKSGEYNLAESQIKKMISLQPKCLTNYKRLGDVYEKQGKYDEAMKEYTDLFNKLPLGDKMRASLHINIAEIYLEKDDIKQAKEEMKKATRAGATTGELAELQSQIEKREKEKQGNTISLTIALVLGIAIIAIIIAFLYNKERKKYIQSVLADFNEKIDKVSNIQDLAEFLPKYFCEYFESGVNGFLMVYNRQNNSLSTINSHVLYNQEPIRIITGNEVTNWTMQEARLIMSVRELAHSALFKKAFPSLVERFQALQVRNVIFLSDKSTFIGLITLGEINPKIGMKKRSYALLEALISTSAQTLQTQHLIEASISDDLTGLYNKKNLYHGLSEELKRADRDRQACSICVADIDNFKQVNETYGPAQGDKILKGIGKIIKENIREGIDIGIRTAGQEFALILPGTNADLAELVADRIRKIIQSTTFEGFETQKTITMSFGVSTYPDLALNDNDMIQTAKTALEVAKQTGKNQVCVYNGQSQTSREEKTKKVFEVKSGQASFENNFEHLNLFDSNTGILNYSYFSMKVQEEIKRCDRYRITFSMFLFSAVPEVSGEIQDEAMKIFAEIIKTQFRENIDICTKLNKNSILLMTPETPKSKAPILAKRIQNSFKEKSQDRLQGNNLRVVGSIASYPECADTADELLNKLITAMDMAKLMETGICICGAEKK